MHHLYESKAGPSAEPEWPREVPRWRRNLQALVKTIAIVTILAVGYVAFVHTKVDRQRYSWFWDLDDSYGAQAGAHATTKGSKYLLGVGKADITGYAMILFRAEKIANEL
jgi:neutral ceramidase